MTRFAWMFATAGMVWIAGCGDDTNNTTDVDGAPSADATAGPDGAPAPDGATATGTCGVHIAIDDDGVEGVRVAFHAPDGSAVGYATTDVSGDASFDGCESGSMITVEENILRGGEGWAPPLRTFAGLEPGQTIQLITNLPTPGLPPINIDITLNTNNPPVTGDNFIIFTGCASSYTNVPATISSYSDGCQAVSSNTVDVMGVARMGGTRLGYTFALDVALETPTTTVATTGDWVGVQPLMVSAANTPVATLNSSSVGYALRMNGFEYDRQFKTVSTPSQQVAMSIADPAVGDGLELFFNGTGYRVDATNYVEAVTRVVGTSTDNAFDYATVGLPTLAGAVLETSTPSRPTVHVVANGDASAADGGFTEMRWIEQNGSWHEWSMVFPGGPMTIQFPQLPDTMAGGAPSGSTQSIDLDRVGYWRNSETTYDDIILGTSPFESLVGDTASGARTSLEFARGCGVQNSSKACAQLK